MGGVVKSFVWGPCSVTRASTKSFPDEPACARRARVNAKKTNRSPRARSSVSTSGSRRIEALEVENVRCFAHAVVPLDAAVTVIIGQNGAGKTTIAEAIASLVPGDHEGLVDAFPRRRGTAKGSMTLRGHDKTPLAQWTSNATNHTRQRLAEAQHVFVYGQYRALRPPQSPVRRTFAIYSDPAFEQLAERPLPQNLDDALRRSVTQSLFQFDEYLFRDLAAYVAVLEQMSHYDPAARTSWKRLREWLQNLDSTRIEGVEIVEQEGRRFAAFRHAGVALSIFELSDGYRAMLSVVLDLAIRYTKLFGALADPLSGEAMVVIDEVELNLHPRWQRRVIEQLTTLFPKTQFVLTTHSVAVVQAAIDNRNAVLILDEAPDKSSIVRPLAKGDVERLDGAELDSVLVDEEVFHGESRYSRKYEKLENHAMALREKLDAGDATPRERNELLALLDQLQGLMAREEERESKGPLLSEIAKTQIGLLRQLEQWLSAKEGS